MNEPNFPLNKTRELEEIAPVRRIASDKPVYPGKPPSANPHAPSRPGSDRRWSDDWSS